MTDNNTNVYFSVQITDWETHQTPLKKIRETVFIKEQKVPVELEWDDMDETAYHVFAEVHFNDQSHNDKKLAIGTARIIINNKQAHIGRMAVLPEWRGQGVGSKILKICINKCKKMQLEKIILNAQVYITKFYTNAGFDISSEEFSDAGIPHQQMTLYLAHTPSTP